MIDDDYLLISGIQHYCFCPRQWALIHIENMWQENYLTAEGRVTHDRVHDADFSDVRNGILTIRGLQVRSDRLHITGTCDAVEFIPDPDGIVLHKHEGTRRVRPVEYKHGTSKTNDCDRLQVAAQAICLEEMFSCQIPEVCLYYAKSHRREYIPLTDELRTRVEEIVTAMLGLYRRGYTPRVRPKKGCDNCSLKEDCLPDLLKSHDSSVADYIQRHLKEEDAF